MPEPATAPEPGSGGVRTDGPPSLVGSRCPVCQERTLRGRQTVCSGRCRARRWRETQAARNPEIRAALEAIAHLARATLQRLDREGHR